MANVVELPDKDCKRAIIKYFSEQLLPSKNEGNRKSQQSNRRYEESPSKNFRTKKYSV